MIKNCLICGKRFKVDSWSLKHRAASYCSRACGHISRKTGENKKCLFCGKLFYLIPAVVKRSGRGLYCSKNCMWKSPYRNSKLTGENHYKWKGGNKNLERTRFRDTMQKLVFERDNYICQICGIKGGYLQVDHIQSWADYLELRFDINNCRTVCQKCHYFITFGHNMPKNVTAWGHNYKHL